MNKCGDCQVCCEVFNIPTISKEKLTKCPNQCSKGCSIYENRPSECAKFNCMYIINEHWGEELRPDKCGVMIANMVDGYKACRVRDEVSPEIMKQIELIKEKSGTTIEGVDARKIKPF